MQAQQVKYGMDPEHMVGFEFGHVKLVGKTRRFQQNWANTPVSKLLLKHPLL